ncbi:MULTISPECIES: histidine phosphatase family protein [unclassified Roseovarius]|uniref:histidine phosphatase family protein n=1 Tax=unclassified Roseovarius TaxID=2614913 RepID=UPI00273E9589|nr:MULTISPECIES: histidine phosphatase family protein [unclassified Roseovarius]
MDNLPKIWFLRHGQTEWNAEGRIQGRLNSDLTAQGRADAGKQAALIAPFVAEVRAGAGGIYVSPQGRAQETARIALSGQDYAVDERLAEINTGDWEGKLRSEIPRADTDIDTYTAAPGGEGLAGLAGRVEAFLAALTGPSIIVSHGILGKVLRARACGLDDAEMKALCNRQGVVYVLENGTEKILA